VFNKDVKVPLHEAELVGTSSSNIPCDDGSGGGGDGGVGWTWLDDVLDGCGIEVRGGGVDTALPQVQVNIA
jgi:hypothetical protein